MAGTIICYGDSNTYGYDPQLGGSGRYGANGRWTGILKQRLEEKLENHGICGRCIPHLKSQIETACAEVQGWIEREGQIELWIMLGTNDLLQSSGFTAEAAAARMEVFLERLQKEVTECGREDKMRIRLIAPPLMQYGAWVNEERIYQESRRLGNAYQRLAEKWQLDFNDAGKWELPTVFDGVHLSEEGHRRFAECLLDALRQEQK